MNITVNLEICNREFEKFEEFVSGIYREMMRAGCEIVRQALEGLDAELMKKRDKQRFRSKGPRKTCIKTIMGEVEYQRQVYVDQVAAERTHCVYLLDSALGIEKVGLMSTEVCQLAATGICESTYRATAKMISQTTGLRISHQGVHNLVRRLGEKQSEIIEKHTALAMVKQGVGIIESKLLYEENDGIWLNLQGKSRKLYGASREMKVGIAYDGVRYQPERMGKKPSRRLLSNKVAYASFEDAKVFRKRKEGLVASRFNVDEIELRVLNGDGGNWIPKKNGIKSIGVLDKFHRNKKITECVKDKAFAGILRELLFAGNIDGLLGCIEAQINSLLEGEEVEKLRELYRYYSEHRDVLKGYYDRGMPIPETREPGVVHHARLGSMESNVFTLIGNRMKGRRACWSIEGANHLALLLCAYHTSGMENLFAPLSAIPFPQRESEYIDTAPVFGAGSIPVREGKGYEFWATTTLSSSSSGWVKFFAKRLRKTTGNNF